MHEEGPLQVGGTVLSLRVRSKHPWQVVTTWPLPGHVQGRDAGGPA